MTRWYVAINNVSTGPFSEEDIGKKIADGAISRGALIWQKGMKTWEPIITHFSTAFPDKAISSDIISPQIAQPTSSFPIPDAKSTEGVEDRIKSLSAFFKNQSGKHFSFFCAILITFFVIHTHSDKLSNTALFAVLWGGSLLGTLISGGIFIRALWKIANRGITIIPQGMAKLLCFFSGACLIVFVIIFAPNASTIYRIRQARLAFDKYTMHVEPAQDAIIINGLIGPSFSAELKRNLEIHSGTRFIVITSPGGLVDQGLEAAKIIQYHGNLSVIAKGTCNSSCLLVLMAGDNKFADWNMNLGFHAISAITSVDDAVAQELTKVGDEANEYLSRQGIPRDIISRANAKGHKEMELVPAVKLAEIGVINGLIEGKEAIPIYTAKWRIVEEVILSSKDKNAAMLAQVLAIIRENASAIVENYADELYDAYANDDIDKIRVAARIIIRKVVPAAVAAADGLMLQSYILSSLKQIDYLIDMEDWNTCAQYVDGDVESGLNILSQSSLENEYNALQQLISSAGAKNWHRQPIPKWAEQRGTEIAKKAMLVGVEVGINIDEIDKDNKVKCLWNYILMKLITDEGPDRAPPVIRWLILQEEK